MTLGRGRSTVADDAALLTLELPPRPEAATAARRALTSLNGAMHLVSEARLRDAQLLVSELVANAVRHGGDGEHPVRLEVRATDEALHVAVIDAGAGFAPERLASPSVDRAGGWGLALVAALARRWGVEAGVLTSVWFEIDRPQRESPVPVHDTIVPPSPGSDG
jgi:serine/threonine-protein kinase RsbW